MVVATAPPVAVEETKLILARETDDESGDPTSVLYSSCLECSVDTDDWATAMMTMGKDDSTADFRPSDSKQVLTVVPLTINTPKRVRFGFDTKGRLALSVHEYEPLLDPCLEELYYSPQEIVQNQAKDRKQAKAFIKENKQYRNYLKNHVEGKTDDTITRETVLDLIVEASDVRGLESSMTKMYRAQRKLNVLTVLELQQRIKGMTCYQTDLQRQTMLEMGLRAKCTEVSRTFRSLALLMAEADAKLSMPES